MEHVRSTHLVSTVQGIFQGALYDRKIEKTFSLILSKHVE